jgi:hypothetical protein
MYYIDHVREPPTRRSVSDPEVVDVVQAHEFDKIGPFDPVDVRNVDTEPYYFHKLKLGVGSTTES